MGKRKFAVRPRAEYMGESHLRGASMYSLVGDGIETVDDHEEWGFTNATATRLAACYRACHGMVDPEEGIALMRMQIDMLRATKGVPGWVTEQHIKDLRRFDDCAQDGEGYDVPKPRMQSLAGAGLVAHASRGIYSVTDFGRFVLDAVEGAP